MLPTKSFAWVWTVNVMVRDNLKKELQLLLSHQKSTSCWIPKWGLHLAQPCICQEPSRVLHLLLLQKKFRWIPSKDSMRMTARIVWEWPCMKKSCFSVGPISSRLWNDLPPELHTISSPPPPSLQITRHHLHLPPLSVTPRAFHSKLKSHLFKHSYPDPSDHSPSPSQQHPP